MELFEVIHSQRAIRRFNDEPVPDELVRKILDAAIRAPSGGNRQPWRVVVVRDNAIRARIREISLREWELYVTTWYGDVESLSEKRRGKLHEGTAYHETLDSAPVHFLVWTELAALAAPHTAAGAGVLYFTETNGGNGTVKQVQLDGTVRSF